MWRPSSMSPRLLLCLSFISILLSFNQTLRLQNSVFGGILILSDTAESELGQPTIPVHSSTRPVRKWAYAFVIGGCGSNRPEYRGFLYNIFVAAHTLRQLGSKADVVVYIQMSTFTNESKLPDNETRILDELNVRTIYLPKFDGRVHEVFYTLMLEKFRILNATDYSRVIFLDGDVMPLCPLDYLFELSEPKVGAPILKENVVLSWKRDPANGGFFMLQPSTQDYLKLQEVIRSKEENALKLPEPHWDVVEGWGHRIAHPDFWRSQRGKTGTNWTWHGAFADQGLLYHWTKYVKQSVSIIISDEVENWTRRSGSAYLEKTLKGILNNFTTCVPPVRGNFSHPSPYRDIKHFTGRSKPWLPHRRNSTDPLVQKWYQTLRIVGEQTNTTPTFDFTKRPRDGGPPMGVVPLYEHMIEHIRAKASKNWTHFAQ